MFHFIYITGFVFCLIFEAHFFLSLCHKADILTCTAVPEGKRKTSEGNMTKFNNPKKYLLK